MVEKVGIYCRVSTSEQETSQQIDELKSFCERSGYQIVKTYTDEGISGFKANRPGYLSMLEDVRKRKLTLVICWKLDRLSRSLKELITTLEYFKQYGVNFISYSQNGIDTSNSTGKLLFHVFGLLAEFEHDLISERTRLKLNHLKKQGRILGRPPKICYESAIELKNQGLSLRAMANRLGCNASTVSRVLHKG